MPVTDAFGITRTSIPYGTYSYTVLSNGVTTAPTGVTLRVTTTNYISKLLNGSLVSTTYLPGPVVVTSS
jgi:hypothetical protein